jgi:hypothetical protein
MYAYIHTCDGRVLSCIDWWLVAGGQIRILPFFAFPIVDGQKRHLSVLPLCAFRASCSNNQISSNDAHKVVQIADKYIHRSDRLDAGDLRWGHQLHNCNDNGNAVGSTIQLSSLFDRMHYSTTQRYITWAVLLRQWISNSTKRVSRLAPFRCSNDARIHQHFYRLSLTGQITHDDGSQQVIPIHFSLMIQTR